MKNRIRRSGVQTAKFSYSLESLIGDESDSPKWVQVTREGNFPGYLGGLKPFSFTRADLEQMVANLKTHPSYKLENGVAVGEVIPWDFNHASEADPTSGSLPSDGSPARAWTLDMEVRNAVDGTAELWALTKFLEPAKTYVKAGQYKWASVAVSFNAVHPETAQNVGALVTSIALTNTPFVEGMAELAATKGEVIRGNTRGIDEGRLMLRRNFYEGAQSAAEAINMMRELFMLPETTGAMEIMDQIRIVQSWISAGAAPLGTDPEHIVGNLRTILNLPALSAQTDVLEEAATSIQRLLEEQATAVGSTPSTTNSGTTSGATAIAAERQKEEAMDLLKFLASKLSVRESEESVKESIAELIELRSGLKDLFKLSRDSAKVILEAAGDSAKARDNLVGLFGALGVEDADAAASRVADVISSAAKLEELMPELKALRAKVAESEEKEIESDVDSAIAASKLPSDQVRDALILLRRTSPEKFAEKYPKAPAAPAAPAAPVVPDHLLSAVAVRGNQVVLNADGSQLPASTPTPAIDLNQYPGPNPTAKAKAYLAATRRDWATMTREQQHIAAITLKRSLQPRA